MKAQGKPTSHEKAKEILSVYFIDPAAALGAKHLSASSAGIAGFAVDRLVETKGVRLPSLRCVVDPFTDYNHSLTSSTRSVLSAKVSLLSSLILPSALIHDQQSRSTARSVLLVNTKRQ